MNKFRIKDIFTIICTISTIVTSIVIILTFLATYHFINNMPMFNSYLILQIGIGITMSLWGVRFFIYRKGRERYTYTLACIILAIASLVFVMTSVR